MRRSLYFLSWWMIFALICLGSVAAYLLGIFDKTNAADVTKLSFFIYALFIGFTIRTGAATLALQRVKTVTKEILEDFTSKQELSWFVCEALLILGMLGTIIGIIYALEGGSLDPSNMENLRSTLQSLKAGMGTALYTTAAGMICNILLKVQLFNLAQAIVYLDKGISDEISKS